MGDLAQILRSEHTRRVMRVAAQPEAGNGGIVGMDACTAGLIPKQKSQPVVVGVCVVNAARQPHIVVYVIKDISLLDGLGKGLGRIDQVQREVRW